MAFDSPIATTNPSFAHLPNRIEAPNNWWGPNISFPYPTNAWWIDFVLYDNADAQVSRSDRRTTVWPYNLHTQTDGLTFNNPFIWQSADQWTLKSQHQINYDATAYNHGWASAQAPAIWRYIDIIFGATEATSSRYLDSFDDLTATMKWSVDASHYMSAPIAKGMPYVTMRYTAMTPKLTLMDSDYHTFSSVNGSAPSGSFTGTKFVLKVTRPYASGGTETWILYASLSITLSATTSTLTATAPFAGSLRMAVVPHGTAAEETILDAHASVIPVSGVADVTFSGDTATTTFTYGTVGGTNLLTYSLPNQREVFSSPTYENLQIYSLRGMLQAVTGTTLTMNDALTTTTWDSPNALDSGKVAAIQAALNVEKNLTFGDLMNDQAYIYGKKVARAARLALIADQIGDTAARDAILTPLKQYLNQWFTTDGSSATQYAYVYDTTWGGIVSAMGYHMTAANDPTHAADYDFGNVVFNDHHFMYGYIVYAAAVVARYDTAWATTYKSYVNDLIRDFANPSSADPYFTKMRHFDWYERHSWAGGLQVNGDGRNQESTSEAINAWYGVNLWGLVTSQTNVKNLGRYLQAVEGRAAQLFWQVPSTSTVYPADFVAQRRIVPLVFANKAFYGTWFSSAEDCRVEIEAMPFTPASHALLPKTWVQEVYVKNNLASANSLGWLGYTYSMLAIFDAATAYTNINAFTANTDSNIDNGTSKTNLLWWTAVQGATTTATATTTVLTVSPSSPVNVGTNVTLTATVSPAVAGSVTFKDTSTTLGTATVSGSVATFTTTVLASGSHNLSATFTPTDIANYAASNSSTLAYTVNTVVSSGFGGLVGSNAGTTRFISLATTTPHSENRLGVNDADTAVAANQTIVAFTTLSASRTVTLPAPGTIGRELIIKDESGSCSASITITLAGTVDGMANRKITTAFGSITIYDNGASWSRLAGL